MHAHLPAWVSVELTFENWAARAKAMAMDTVAAENAASISSRICTLLYRRLQTVELTSKEI